MWSDSYFKVHRGIIGMVSHQLVYVMGMLEVILGEFRGRQSG